MKKSASIPTIREAAAGESSVQQKNAFKALSNIVVTTAILKLQLSYLENVTWPSEMNYTSTELHREYNSRRLEEWFTKEQ
jgi:hypothetical protein